MRRRTTYPILGSYLVRNQDPVETLSAQQVEDLCSVDWQGRPQLQIPLDKSNRLDCWAPSEKTTDAHEHVNLSPIPSISAQQHWSIHAVRAF